MNDHYTSLYELRPREVKIRTRTTTLPRCATPTRGNKHTDMTDHYTSLYELRPREVKTLFTGNQETYNVDTNVVAIKFGILAEAKQVHTGDPVVCGNSKCTAVLNSYSVINEDNKVWECELCGFSNEVDTATEEIPLKRDVLYATPLVATPQRGKASPGLVGEQPRDAVVVFCIDTSGSMCETTEVPGEFAFKEKGQDECDKLFDQFAEGESQYLPHERRDISYISRLQSVQVAVDYELTMIDAKQRVALVTFNSEVMIVGDGILDEVTIAGDRLSSYEALMKIGSELPIPSRIGQVRQYLGEKIWSLKEKGQTALGPALLISVLLAGNAPGSKVIVCTDGKANTGVGQLSDKLQSAAHYTKVGELARDKSVTVSILTIKGTEAGLLALGKVQKMTEGKVNIVDPLKIKDEFSNILSTSVIATSVSAKLVMHKDMYIADTNESVLQIPVGNVTATTERAYKFGFRCGPSPLQQLRMSVMEGASVHAGSTAPVHVGGPPQLPFQVQISYTAPDGSSYLRVVTSTRPLAKTVEEAMKGANAEVMGNYAVQRASEMSTCDRIDEAEQLCQGVGKFLEKRFSKSPKLVQIRHMTDNLRNSPKNDQAALAVLMPTSSIFLDDDDDDAESAIYSNEDDEGPYLTIDKKVDKKGEPSAMQGTTWIVGNREEGAQKKRVRHDSV